MMDVMAQRGPSLGREERLRIRNGDFTGPTSGLAPGNVQANLAILPKDLANDFLRFCMANPKPCPVLAVSDPGDPSLPTLGYDLDLRSDLPRYRVWRNGELAEEPTDISHVWRDDLVSFAIGCSFSFEAALSEDGIEVRHITCGSNVPMYRTSIPCDPVPVGPNELPVFWACGVTPQAVIAAVRPEFCITHAPGSMLITDLRNSRLAAL